MKEYINLNPYDLNEICDYQWVSIWELAQFIFNNKCNRTLRDLDKSNIINDQI